jgi:hypothetical protein
MTLSQQLKIHQPCASLQPIASAQCVRPPDLCPLFGFEVRCEPGRRRLLKVQPPSAVRRSSQIMTAAHNASLPVYQKQRAIACKAVAQTTFNAPETCCRGGLESNGSLLKPLLNVHVCFLNMSTRRISQPTTVTRNASTVQDDRVQGPSAGDLLGTYSRQRNFLYLTRPCNDAMGPPERSDIDLDHTLMVTRMQVPCGTTLAVRADLRWWPQHAQPL